MEYYSSEVIITAIEKVLEAAKEEINILTEGRKPL